MLLTLRKKILFGYGLVIALLLIVLIWSLFSLYKLGNASSLILSKNYKSILAAKEMIDAIERQDSGILLLILGYSKEGLGQYRENEEQFFQSFGRAKDNITEPGEDKIINTIDSAYAEYISVCSNLQSIYETEKMKAEQYYHETVLSAFHAVRGACSRLREINQQAMFEASDKAERLSENSTLSVAILGFVTVGLGLFLSIFLSSIIVKPLRNLERATREIAKGNYDIQLEKTSSDELGTLSEKFTDMARELKRYSEMNISKIWSEKQKSEAIIHSIDDGIIVVDSDYKISGINRTAAIYLQVDSAQALDRHFLEVFSNKSLFNYLKQTNKTGKVPYIKEDKNIIMVNDGASDKYLQFSIVPVHEKSGPTFSIVLVLRDVTRLKQLDHLKSEFVTAASHELRTPLTSMSMSIDLLHESAIKKLSKKEKELISAATEEIERLKALVNDLLDLSKIEAGKMEMDIRKISINKALEHMLSVMQAQAEEKGIRLTSNLSKNLPSVKADIGKITLVLNNLVSNALRYTEKGETIDLSAKRVGDMVHISVKDNGKGIPIEYQSKIFEKFIRVKGDTESKGSGLGLSICKEIVKAHGGTIWVDSAPGRGSEFTFTLPRA
jgi:NtrC-family two-component system sensor histidine kinase KinB